MRNYCPGCDDFDDWGGFNTDGCVVCRAEAGQLRATRRRIGMSREWPDNGIPLRGDVRRRAGGRFFT